MAHIKREDILLLTINDREKIKKLGELFSNKSSIDIYFALTENHFAANELAVNLDLRLNNVMHHLKKMQEISLISTYKKFKPKHGPYLNYYYAKSIVLVTPHMSLLKDMLNLDIQDFKNHKKN